MAQVPFTGLSGQPSSPGTIIPDDYQRISTSPDAFGASVAQGGQQLAAGLNQAGNDAGQILQLHNQAAADDAQNQLGTFARKQLFGDPNDPNQPGYLSLQGDKALNAYAPTVQALNDQRDALSSNLSPQAKLLFDSQSRRYISSLLDTAGSHNIQQGQVWRSQTANATVDNHLQDAQAMAAVGNERGWLQGVGTAQAASADYLRSTGADQATIDMQTRNIYSKAASQRIQQMSVTDPVGAQQFFQKNQANIDPSAQAPLMEMLKTRVDTAQAQAGAAYAGVGAVTRPLPAGPLTDKITAAAAQYGVAPGVALTTANIESGVGTVPNRPGSQYQGPFQMGDAAWAARGGTADNRSDPDAQVSLGVANVKHSQDVASAALGQPAQGWQTYVVHQQGDAGGSALLKADPASSAVSALASAYGGDIGQATKAVVANGGTANSTVGQFLQHWQQTYQAKQVGDQAAPAAGTASTGPAPYSVPDLGGMLQKFDQYAQANGLSPEATERGEGLVIQNHSRQMAMGATERENLKQTTSDLLPALAQGLPVTIPEARIRAAFPPDEADRMVTGLQIEQQAGTLMKGLQFAPLDQAVQTVQQLQVPGSVQSGRIVLRRGQLMGQGMAPAAAAPTTAATGPSGLPMAQRDGDTTASGPAAPAPLAEAPADMRMRLQIAQRAQSVLQQRQQAIAADPAGYAAQQPDVSAKAAAIDPSKPQTMQDYAASTIALQKQLGVPDDKVRLLTNPQVSGLVSKLVKQDPAQGDSGAQLDQMATQYGAYWPQVFGEMVSQGKLPRDYQTLATMDQPGQVNGRQDFQRMLTTMAQKGGPKEIMDGLPDGAQQELKQNVDGVMAPFQATTQANAGGLSLYSDVRDSVMHLAAYRLSTGAETNATKALNGAYDDVIGQKYDLGGPHGAMRVPKGQLDDAIAATSNALAGLQPGDVKQIGPGQTPGMTPADNQNAFLRDVKSQGYWVPNKDDTGLALVRPVRNSRAPVAVFRSDGSPMQLLFKDMPYAGSKVGAASTPAAGLPTPPPGMPAAPDLL